MANTIADMLRDVAKQSDVLRLALVELPKQYAEVQAEVVADAYKDIVQTSPVVTGAYRSEHVIEEGTGDGGLILYESPNRAGPDTIVDPPAFIDAPLLAGRAEAVTPFASVTIANRRYYVTDVEYKHGYYVYENAGLRAEVNAERIAERESRRKPVA